MAISWRPIDLGISADVHLPPLLISAAFDTDSYAIHLTDLTHIWAESLNNIAILDRAEEVNTSIDPSDSSSQFEILLSKLALALSSKPNTSMNLHIDPTSGGALPNITLNLMIKLPGGLLPLEWPIHLSAAPQSVFTNHLTIPLLEARHAQIREREGLMEVLKEKDHAIQRLLDKMEAQGTDLGQIFPQATVKGGRKVDRTRVEEKVRGLGTFDMEAWRKDMLGDQVQDTAQLVRNVFSADVALDLGSSVGTGKWWENIEGSTIDFSNGKSAATQAKMPMKPALKPEESIDDNDGFQVQSSPPNFASKGAKASQSVALDDSTEDEDLDVPYQRSKVSDIFSSSHPAALTPPSKPAKKLGKIGGTEVAPKRPSLTAEDSTDSDESPSPKSPLNLGQTRVEKQVESAKGSSSPLLAEGEITDDEPAPQRQPTRSPEPESTIELEPPAKPKLGLGRIGSKKAPLPSLEPKLEQDLPKSVPSPQQLAKPRKGKLGQIGRKQKETAFTLPPSDPESQQDAPPAKKKLGAIGNRNQTAHEDSNSMVVAAVGEERGRSVKAERKTPPPRETSEERAEKKRRELKRELEEKAKAPVKKKRKF